MVYNFITSEPEIREKINVNYRYYTIKSFTFALLTEKGDVYRDWETYKQQKPTRQLP